MVHEAPEKELDELTSVQVFGTRPGTERFARFCPDADRLGETRFIADRAAVGYRCGPGLMAQAFSTAEVWFDEATGVLLQGGPLHATNVKVRPRVDGSTFSTQPAKGVEVTVYPATESVYGQQAPGFELPLDERGPDEQGGTVRLSDYQGRPVVLVPFSSDLYFGPGHECPDCFPSLVTLLEMTDGGTNPDVLAIQSGEVMRAGRPPAPLGVTVVLLDDPRFTVREKYDLSMGHHMAFVFIDRQGRIQHVVDHQATRTDLRAGLNSVR